MPQWNNLTEKKAEKILSESQKALKGTVQVKGIIDKKTTYILGYCLLWVSGLYSYVFVYRVELGIFLIPILFYIFSLVITAIFIFKNLSPDGFYFEGNSSKNIATQEALDCSTELFLIGIAQETDDRFEKNLKLNNKRAMRIKVALQILLCSSFIVGLAIFLLFGCLDLNYCGF
jgi:hypothetical protein